MTEQDGKGFGDWIDHDGNGFPATIPDEHWLHAEGVDCWGEPQDTLAIFMVSAAASRLGQQLCKAWDWRYWRRWSDDGSFICSKVLRYRIGRAATPAEIAAACQGRAG